MSEACAVQSVVPAVAVCIVTFNSAAYIEGCLACVKAQTWPRVRTVIVDNASADDTPSRITAWMNRHAEQAIEFIANADNRGFAGGQNQAIAAAPEADYVLVLNPDVTLAPGYIEALVLAMEAGRAERIGSASGCLVQAASPALIDSAGLAMNWLRSASERGSGEPAADYARSGEVFGVSGAAAVYARAMIDDISVRGQFFDEAFFAYKEDVDIAWRARTMGWRSWYEAAARAGHVRQWGSEGGRKRITLRVRRHSYLNRYRMIVKNESFDWRWWIRLPALIAVELAYHILLLRRDPRVLGCWFEGKRWLSDAIAKRRELRRMRRFR